MYKDYPVGAAQAKALDALGLTASGFNEAKAVFEKLGIDVDSKRVGRSSVPVVTLQASASGGFTSDGDGDVATRNYRAVDLTPLFQWMSAGEQCEAQRRMDAASASVSSKASAAAPTGDDLSREVQADRKAATDLRYEEEAQRKAARQQRALNRARLYAAGYRWRNYGNGEDEEDEWALYMPTGEPVTLAAALTALGVR